jgi:hypothetical protein
MDKDHPKFKKLELHLSFLIEQFNQDIEYLRESDLEIQRKFELPMEKILKRICLIPDFISCDISFLHEEFQAAILDYESHLNLEFSELECQDLSKELIEQIEPEDFGI